MYAVYFRLIGFLAPNSRVGAGVDPDESRRSFAVLFGPLIKLAKKFDSLGYDFYSLSLYGLLNLMFEQTYLFISFKSWCGRRWC